MGLVKHYDPLDKVYQEAVKERQEGRSILVYDVKVKGTDRVQHGVIEIIETIESAGWVLVPPLIFYFQELSSMTKCFATFRPSS